jgi:hypothetical protein
MSAVRQFPLRADSRGAIWDLLLYVPTVVALAFWSATTWFAGDHSLAYLLAFLASFFFLVGANRVLKTRLMVLPAAPVRIDVDTGSVAVLQRNGTTVELVKDQRVFGDMAGRSFGLTGLNRTGKRLEYVFHRGQFIDDAAYTGIREALERLLVRGGKPEKTARPGRTGRA